MIPAAQKEGACVGITQRPQDLRHLHNALMESDEQDRLAVRFLRWLQEPFAWVVYRLEQYAARLDCRVESDEACESNISKALTDQWDFELGLRSGIRIRFAHMLRLDREWVRLRDAEVHGCLVCPGRDVDVRLSEIAYLVPSAS